MGLKNSAREIAEKITKKELPPQHLGSHTLETLHQEMISLCQTKPAFRTAKWRERFNKLIENFGSSNLPMDKIRPMRWEMQRIEAMR